MFTSKSPCSLYYLLLQLRQQALTWHSQPPKTRFQSFVQQQLLLDSGIMELQVCGQFVARTIRHQAPLV